MSFILKKVKTNEVLVKYGLGAGGDKPKIKRGGLAIIIPILQGAKTLSLEPFNIDVHLTDALDKNNIRVSIPSVFTVAISDQMELIEVAAKRVLDMSENNLVEQVKDIILGQLRGVLSGMTIEEINTDRDKFEDMVEKNINTELQKLGIDLINVNITDITDKVGYIESIGQKAEAEAKSQAKIDISRAKKEGDIGSEQNYTETEVRKAELEKERIEKQTLYEAELAEARKDNQIRTAEAAKEVRLKEIEFNKQKDVAASEANILKAQKRQEEELASKRADEVVIIEINKEKRLIQADAEAAEILKIAEAKARAIEIEAKAEAHKIEQIAAAKAEGYRKMVSSVGEDNIVNLLLVEKSEELAKIQADALKNIEIDKITVLDSGSNQANGKGGLSSFVNNFVNSMPAYHELAKTTGITLPDFMGKLNEEEVKDAKEEIEENKN